MERVENGLILRDGNDERQFTVDQLITALTTGGGVLTPGSVGTTELAADAVTTAKILDGTITNNDISSTAAITNTKLAGILPVINPKDAAYGVKADGSTDDTSAWNAVIAAINATTYGAILIQPLGVSVVSSTLSTVTAPVYWMGMGMLYQDQTKGSVIRFTASNSTLLNFSSPGVTLVGCQFMHDSSGTRSSGLIGVSMTNSNFNRINRCLFSGFSTNLKVASGVYWNVTESVFRDFILKGVDASFTSAAPDAGDPLIAGNLFDRTGADVSNGVTGGDAIYLQNIGGTRCADNKINGPTGANGFDNGVRFDAAAAKTSTIVSVTGGSIEGCKTAAVRLGGSNTGAIYTVIVSDVEISGLNTSGSTGVLADNPLVQGIQVSTHMKDIDTCVDLTNTKHGSIMVNGRDVNVSGLRLRTLCRDVKLSPASTFDGAAGVQAVVFDVGGIQNRANQEYETWIPFDSISDTSAHTMFEIGVGGFASVIVDVDITGVNQGVGAFAHKLRRVVTGTGGGDSTVSAALADESTVTGSLTSTFLVASLTGPMRYQITKAAGTSMSGEMRVRVFGQGLTYFKQSNRDD